MQAYYSASETIPNMSGMVDEIVLHGSEFISCQKISGQYECNILNNYIKGERLLGNFDDVQAIGLKAIKTPELGLINIFPRYNTMIKCTTVHDDGMKILSCSALAR